MEPQIEVIPPKKLTGKKLRMSLAGNKTGILWQSFMPHRKEIENKVSTDLISMQVYPDPIRFGDMHQEFDKWAAVEVADFNNVPSEMETYTLEGGHYAIFHYKGLSTDPSIFIYIFTKWLPKSDYLLDHSRPHFEVLGDKYKNNDPDSEEDIYIPIKKK